MQTLTIHDNQFSSFNALSVFSATTFDKNKRGLVLLEQLQTTLELEKLLNIFAMEAAKYVDFSGVCFKSAQISQTMRGSRPGKLEKTFELRINNERIGQLTYSVNSSISLANYKILEELHQYLVYPLKNAISYYQAMQLAMQDALTGLGNRRYFDEQLKRAMHHAKRQHTQVGLIISDLNKFKLINDTHGHHLGDQVLQHFSKALQASIRDSDSVFRFGGDEFVILIESASQQSLNMVKSRITHSVAMDDLLSAHHVSCSLGDTLMTKTDNEHSFFERADQALYQNKKPDNCKLEAVR